jgi:O-acetyl-ADP-ribose deacetylase
MILKTASDTKCLREITVGNSKILLIKGNISNVSGGVMMLPIDISGSITAGLSEYVINSAGNKVSLQIRKCIREIEQLSPGQIILTGAGTLTVLHLLHVCIPICNFKNPEPQVRMFILKILEKAEELKVNSVVLPCIPKDVFGFTPEQCASGYFSTVIEYTNSNKHTHITEIKLVGIDKPSSNALKSEANRRFVAIEKHGFFRLFRKKKKKARVPEIELKNTGEFKSDTFNELE